MFTWMKNKIKWPFSWAKDKIKSYILNKIKEELMKMEWLAKIWDFLSGKKTAIGMIAFLFAEFLGGLSGQIGDPSWIPQVVWVLDWIARTLGTVGLTHKALK